MKGNVIDIIHVGELKIYAVLMYHCATSSAWPSPLLVFYWPLLQKLWTPVLNKFCIGCSHFLDF